jgi:hypothetical protein
MPFLTTCNEFAKKALPQNSATGTQCTLSNLIYVNADKVAIIDDLSYILTNEVLKFVNCVKN